MAEEKPRYELSRGVNGLDTHRAEGIPSAEAVFMPPNMMRGDISVFSTRILLTLSIYVFWYKNLISVT